MRDMHPVDRPRERLLSRGPEALSDEELVAVLLRTGCVGLSVLDLARALVRRYPRGSLAKAPPKELSRWKGMGSSRAAVLVAAVELGKRWGGRETRRMLEEPAQVWRELEFLQDKRKEYFVALYLNARNQLLHRETVSIGTLTASLVHPREVFSPALERGAAGVIVAHNHPSGDVNPSPEDREATRRLAQAGRVLGIALLDHVLVADSGYFSFREHGLLED